ncbi:MAG: hypothetical protein ACP5NY_08185 [Thermocladium sp.]
MKCGVPFCVREASEGVKIVGKLEVELCSEHASKFRKIENYWDSINEDAFNKLHPLLYNARNLLGDALSLFAMGFNDASAVMVRASLEAALHSVLSMRNPRFSNDGMLSTYDHDKAYDKYSLSQLICEAKKKELLGGELVECAMRIKDYGDFAAHVNERQWKQFEAFDPNNFKLWTNDNEAEEALKCIIKIINHLTSKIARGS